MTQHLARIIQCHTKLGNYERALLIAEIILLRASERQKTKIHETWSLCQHHRDPITSLQHLSSGTSHCQLASSETHTASSRKLWHSFAGPFSGYAWPSLLQSTSTAYPSLATICCNTSMLLPMRACAKGLSNRFCLSVCLPVRWKIFKSEYRQG